VQSKAKLKTAYKTEWHSKNKQNDKYLTVEKRNTRRNSNQQKKKEMEKEK
jgi:hypothetical protein